MMYLGMTGGLGTSGNGGGGGATTSTSTSSGASKIGIGLAMTSGTKMGAGSCKYFFLKISRNKFMSMMML